MTALWITVAQAKQDGAISMSASSESRTRTGVTLKVHGKFTRVPMWATPTALSNLAHQHWNFSNLTGLRHPHMPATIMSHMIARQCRERGHMLAKMRKFLEANTAASPRLRLMK